MMVTLSCEVILFSFVIFLLVLLFSYGGYKNKQTFEELLLN